jgi:hypothetical protein
MTTRTPLGKTLRRTLGLILGLGLLAATACTSASSPPAAGLSCAWRHKVTRDTLNVAYPDTGATYWSMSYNLIAGDRIEIEGTFPEARYISFVTYGLSGSAVDHLTDRDIQADAGSLNPFADPGAPSGGTYRLTVSSSVGPGAPGNLLAAGGVAGSVVYRSYVADDPADPTGGVGLPAVKVRRADGSVVPIANCPNPAGDPTLVDLINSFGPPTDVAPLDPPQFKRPATVAGLYANPDNGYVAAVAGHQPGKVVVIRAKAPTVPDTEAGESAAVAGRDMRYWSMCTNEYRKPYPVTDCTYDTGVPLDGDGWYTILASTSADRPANATTADGVAWLDWGSTTHDMVLILRNMLPADTFTQDVFEVAPGQPASPTMGDYAPLTATCDRATFEAGGATACGLP